MALYEDPCGLTSHLYSQRTHTTAARGKREEAREENDKKRKVTRLHADPNIGGLSIRPHTSYGSHRQRRVTLLENRIVETDNGVRGPRSLEPTTRHLSVQPLSVSGRLMELVRRRI